MTDTWRSTDGAMELRLGRYQDVMQDVTCDLAIYDAPYSDATHDGYNTVVDGARDNTWHAARGLKNAREGVRPLNYAAWTEDDARESVSFWADRCRGWIVTITDRFLMPFYEDEFKACGRLPFVVPLYQPGSRCRLSGDGPSNWTCWIVCARPRTQEFQRWGTLPGGYSGPVEDMPIVGGKPLWAMRALVRDYSRPGQKVVDCCAGGGTSLLAAAMDGRPSVGCEIDPETWATARDRLARGVVVDMFSAQVPVQTTIMEVGDASVAVAE